MSLLNEALRKKDREQRAAPRHLVPARKQSRNNHTMPLRAIAVALLALTGAVAGAYLYFDDTPPMPVTQPDRTAAARPREAPRPLVPDAPQATTATRSTTPPPAVESTAPAEPAPAPETGHALEVPAAPLPSKPAEAPAPTTTPKSAPVETRPEIPFIDKARSYQQQGLYAKAVSMYREALRLAPGHLLARRELAQSHLAAQDYEGAYALLRDLAAERQDDPRVYLHLASAEIAMHRTDEALSHLDRAEALAGPSYDSLFNRGVALSRLGRMEEAVDNYRRAEEFAPDRPELLFNLALALDKQLRFADAVPYYRAYLGRGTVTTAQRSAVERRIEELRRFTAGQP